ncbi:fungal-specific transcription factor domain-containing protein [Aspergillus multicolor]|uniref:transcription factor domain-containing protein n=1 Tax=Aspergillus multicolor TaxID=41759 RepID=UPI003CCE41BA
MALCDASGPLRHAVLSIAASHLTASGPHLQPAQSLALTAQSHRIADIASLRKILAEAPSNTTNNDSLLASILLLEMSKQFDNVGQTQDGDVNHLLGAMELIRARGGPRHLSSPCGPFLQTQILFYDLLSTVAKISVPSIYRSGLNVTEIFTLQLDLESSRGYHATILKAVAWISELKEMKDTGCFPPNLMIAGQEVKSDVETLEIQGHLSHHSCTTEAHRSAALIYLHRVVFDIGPPHPTTLYHVRRCIDSLAAIPVSSPLVSAHIWLLFTAGCEATEETDREFVKQRLMSMYAERKIQSLRKVGGADGARLAQ